MKLIIILIKKFYDNFIKSPFRCEIYALICLLFGLILSIICGVYNNDWYIFPSTISTLNSQFQTPSGRLFFGTLLLSGILLMKSNSLEVTKLIESINTLGYVCILGIALFPTAQVYDIEKINKNIMITIHGTFAIILFCFVPINKLYKLNHLIKNESSGVRYQKSLKKIHIGKFITLIGCLVFFLGFIICQGIIWNEGTTDSLRDPGQPPKSGKDYWLKSHIFSMGFEILSVFSVFVELALHVYEQYEIRKREEQESKQSNPDGATNEITNGSHDKNNTTVISGENV